MANKQRDYKREYELSKLRGERDKVKNFTVTIPLETFQEFQKRRKMTVQNLVD